MADVTSQILFDFDDIVGVISSKNDVDNTEPTT